MSCASCSAGGLSRRDFVLLTASAVVAGCTTNGNSTAPAGTGHVVDAGPASQVGNSSVSVAHREQGFFLTRSGGQVGALSSYCPHRRCLLEAQADRSFHCPCHGSDFDAAGKVVHGP